MCRNIRTLYNFQPPASDEEVRAAALGDQVKAAGRVATRVPKPYPSYKELSS